MPIALGQPTCREVSPSAPSELAWLLNLLAQRARYAEPALAELDASILPGIGRLRQPVRIRLEQLWNDGMGGCPELMYAAHLADCVFDDSPERLLAWLAKASDASTAGLAMLTEPEQDRPAIVARLNRMRDDAKLRNAYRDILADVWRVASGGGGFKGRGAVAGAGVGLEGKVDTGGSVEGVVPPRHPPPYAARPGFDDLFAHRSEYALSPLYFCMSGGHVVDLDDYVHVAVPSSDLLPVRKVRDAMFVADRLRVLAEPTRVHILIQLLSAPSIVMESARALRVSQPTVMGHLMILRQAGCIQPKRFGARIVLVASRKRVERLLEDARATIARWD